MNQSGIAAVLSFLIPRSGTDIQWRFLASHILVLSWGEVVWILSAGTLGWICHLIAAYTAYRRGKMYMANQVT